MSNNRRAVISFSIMALMIAIVGFGQSWNVALAIVNLCLISAVMSMGLNMQWGFAGLFNAGVMASTVFSYTHLRAHETLRYLVCRLLLEKKNQTKKQRYGIP